MSEPTQALTQTPSAGKVAKSGQTIRSLIEGESFKQQVAKALPKHLAPDRFIRVAITAMTRTPKLAQCDQASFFKALLDLSAMGLEPDGRRAHLIPFENKKRGIVECQLIVDYKGLVELAVRSGSLSKPPVAQIVCENDEFEWDKGTITKHKVDWRKPRGNVYAVYSIAVSKDGGEICDVMTKDEVEAIRKRSRAGGSGPWVTDWNEMAKKTVFRRLSKWLTLSPEYRDALDGDADVLEETRFATARPVIGSDVTLPPAPETPEPEIPEAEVIPEGSDNDGGLGPETPVPVEPPVGKTKAAEPLKPAETAAPAAKQKPAEKPAAKTPETPPAVGVVASIVTKLQTSDIQEVAFTRWACARYKLASMDSIADMNEIAPTKVKMLDDAFGKLIGEFQAANANN